MSDRFLKQLLSSINIKKNLWGGRGRRTGISWATDWGHVGKTNKKNPLKKNPQKAKKHTKLWIDTIHYFEIISFPLWSTIGSISPEPLLSLCFSFFDFLLLNKPSVTEYDPLHPNAIVFLSA